MDYYNIFNDFLKNNGYAFSEDTNDNSTDNEESTPLGVADESCRCGDSDIPGGFQDLNPQTLVVIVTIIGINIANQIPFNIQNAVGNIFVLLGQVIITFNAQQQYFQGGPGRYFNPKYYNVSNSFCNETDYVQNGEVKNDVKGSSKNKKKSKNLEKEISNLKSKINQLQKEIDNLKKSN